MTPEQIAAALGARPMSEQEAGARYTCPGCGAPTHPSSMGHRAYCLTCSEASLPGTVQDNSWRIEYRLSWASYFRRLDEYGPPWFAPKKWITGVRRSAQLRKHST